MDTKKAIYTGSLYLCTVDFDRKHVDFTALLVGKGGLGYHVSMQYVDYEDQSTNRTMHNMKRIEEERRMSEKT